MTQHKSDRPPTYYEIGMRIDRRAEQLGMDPTDLIFQLFRASGHKAVSKAMNCYQHYVDATASSELVGVA